MPTLHLSEAEMKELDTERFLHNQVLVQRRLHCLYLKAGTTLTNVQIGRCMGVHANQVGHYIRCYQSKGLDALTTTYYASKRSVLDKPCRSANCFV